MGLMFKIEHLKLHLIHLIIFSKNTYKCSLCLLISDSLGCQIVQAAVRPHGVVVASVAELAVEALVGAV